MFYPPCHLLLRPTAHKGDQTTDSSDMLQREKVEELVLALYDEDSWAQIRKNMDKVTCWYPPCQKKGHSPISGSATMLPFPTSAPETDPATFVPRIRICALCCRNSERHRSTHRTQSREWRMAPSLSQRIVSFQRATNIRYVREAHSGAARGARVVAQVGVA